MKAKLYLSATKRSMMDITSNLTYHEEKKRADGKVSEDVYKGNLIFSITEKGSDGKAAWENGQKKYLSSFMTKETAKMVFDSIAQDRFLERFGVGGIRYNGGYDMPKNGQLRVKTTKVIPFVNKETGRVTHYVFGIEEGVGKRENQIAVMDGECEVSAKHWVPYTDALKMAWEVLDYIRAEELKAMMNGKPLCTINYGKEGKYPTEARSVEQPVETLPKPEIDKEQPFASKGKSYTDKELQTMSHSALQDLLIQTEHAERDGLKEVYKRAVKEAKRRMGKAL